LDTSLMNTSDTLEKIGTPVKLRVFRSVSDASEKHHVDTENAQRRRSAEMRSKIKRGQPNTVRTGLDKAKSKCTRGSQPDLATTTSDLTDGPISSDLVPQVQLTAKGEAAASLQTHSAEDLNLEQQEKEDDFAEFEYWKSELTASKEGPPKSFTRVFRSPSTPGRDRPSIALIRDCNRGRVLEQAKKYETVIQQHSTTVVTRQKTMETKPTVPTFTQVPTLGNKRRSPTKKYQTRMAVRESNFNTKL